MRINKFLSLAGLGSRRKVEELVISGSVKINGKISRELSTDVLDNDVVEANGKVLNLPTNLKYIMLHKQKGTICSKSDEKGRKTIYEFVKDKTLFYVGRLDYNTEGLLLLTNDGTLANALTRPANKIAKTYLVEVEGEITGDIAKKLASGVVLDDGYKTQPAKIKILETIKNDKKHKDANFVNTRLEIVIFEGKNRQIRRMIEAVDRNVVFLKRTKIGELKLGGLARGTARDLTSEEVKYLKRLCNL